MAPPDIDSAPASFSGELVEAGCWRWVGPTRFEGRPALFLDRDGVVVEEVDYLRRVEDVALIRGAARTIAAFNAQGTPVVLATNQSGIARGYFDWARFDDIQAEIARRLAEEGARLDAVFACGYHEKGEGALRLASHSWRKPGPGMFHAAAEALGVVLTNSVMVGDRAQDLAAARGAGLRAGLHVSTGHGCDPGEPEAASALGGQAFKVRHAEDVQGALDVLPDLAVV